MYSSVTEMRVKLQKNTLFLVVFIVCMTGTILYVYFVKHNNNVNEVILSNFKNVKSRKAAQLVDRVGNFETMGKGEINVDSRGKIIAHCIHKNLSQRSIAKYGVNMACSDKISLDRDIPDTRLNECRYWDYPVDMPKASIIIVYHNEGWSTLVRTINSVMNRTPTRFLEEILLVDDCNERKILRKKIAKYIAKFGKLIKFIRNEEREGLIGAKNRGSREARGEVLVFLDAHCEVNVNWLPPLLEPIYRDRTVMTVPIIDVIDLNNFRYRSGNLNGDYRGGFDWSLLYVKHKLTLQQEKSRKYRSEPYDSPTHAGGLFAIDREFFLLLNAYDPGLLIWGGENMELSFKIWQCGGSIKWVPCSRVGHVFRKFLPYDFWKRKKGPLDLYNYKRVVETWFDPKHKEYFYTRVPLARFLDHGDISKQLNIKQRLQCKSFQWYMKHVAYDIIPDLPRNLFWGELRNVGSNSCMDTTIFGIPSLMKMMPCHGFGRNQLIRLNVEGQLAVAEYCIDGDQESIKLVLCSSRVADGPWSYYESSQLMVHDLKKMCLAQQPATHHLFLRPCQKNNIYQKWIFRTLRPWW